MLSKIAEFYLMLRGWTLEKNLPPTKKFEVVAAPHTSNWDFWFFLLYVWAIGHKIRFGAKHTLFRPPLGWLLKKLGGVPIDRRVRTNFIDRMAEEFEKNEEFVLTITPEGTRSATEYWKTGFYRLAEKAGVPIAIGYIDYEKKRVGVAGYFTPTGDIEKDVAMLAEFYEDKRGKYPSQEGKVQLKNRKEAKK